MKVYDTQEGKDENRNWTSDFNIIVNFNIKCDRNVEINGHKWNRYVDCYSEMPNATWTDWVSKLRDMGWAISEKDDHALCPGCLYGIAPILNERLDRFHCEDVHELVHVYNEFIDEPDDKLTGDAIEMRDALKEIIQKKQPMEFREMDIKKIINVYNETIDKLDHNLTNSVFIMKNILKKMIQGKNIGS